MLMIQIAVMAWLVFAYIALAFVAGVTGHGIIAGAMCVLPLTAGAVYGIVELVLELKRIRKDSMNG